MKIQFISNYSHLYGANKVLLTIVEHFNSTGNEVSVLLPSRGGMCEELDKLKISYTVIPYFSSFLYIKKSLKYISLPFLWVLNIIVFPKLLSKIRSFKPDVIYSNTTAENLGIIAAKMLNIKHISHVHEFMSLDHRAYFVGDRAAKKKYIDKSDGVIYVTNCVANYVNLNQSLSPNKKVIYNGVNSPDMVFENKILTEQLNFGVVGILDPGKGQHQAIEYFKDVIKVYPKAKLHIFGDKSGGYKDFIMKLVKTLALEDNVIFHGFVNNSLEIYSQIDILLMFSKSEGFGLVTVEAMLYGVPVVGFDNAGTAELIDDKVTGYLFQDKMSFDKCISSVLVNSNYNLIRKNALNVAKDKFNVSLYGERIEKFVKEIYLSN